MDAGESDGVPNSALVRWIQRSMRFVISRMTSWWRSSSSMMRRPRYRLPSSVDVVDQAAIGLEDCASRPSCIRSISRIRASASDLAPDSRSALYASAGPVTATWSFFVLVRYATTTAIAARKIKLVVVVPSPRPPSAWAVRGNRRSTRRVVGQDVRQNAWAGRVSWCDDAPPGEDPYSTRTDGS